MAGVCRICREARDLSREIFAEKEPGKRLYQVINEICKLGIHLEDGQSKHICVSCHKSVLEFYRFKRTVHEGQAALESIQKRFAKDKRKVSTKTLCRLCVNQSNLYRNIFYQKHHGVYIYNLINELCCLNVSPSDDFPTWICQECLSKVIDFHKFKYLAQMKNSTEGEGCQERVRVKSNAVLFGENGSQSTEVPSGLGVGSGGQDVPHTGAEGDNSFSSSSSQDSNLERNVETSYFSDSDYEDYLEYWKYADFIDTFPLTSGDPCREACVLQEMALSLPHSRGVSGVGKLAIETKMNLLRSASINQKKIHELRLKMLKTEAACKEQELKNVRELSKMQKWIREKEGEIAQIKARADAVRQSRISLGKSGKSLEHDGKVITPDADPATDPASSPPMNESVKEEPEDLFEVHEMSIKEEPPDEEELDSAEVYEQGNESCGSREEQVAVSRNDGKDITPDTDAATELAGSPPMDEEEPEDLFEVHEMSIKLEPPDDEELDRPTSACASPSASNGEVSQVVTSSPLGNVREVIGESQEPQRNVTSPNEPLVKVSRKRQSSEDVSEGEVTEPKVINVLPCSMETMRLAVEKVASHHWSVWMAANHFDIPMAVLRKFLSISEKSGYLQSLGVEKRKSEFRLSPDGEDKLVRFVTEMKQRGFGVSEDRVREMAFLLAEKEQDSRPLFAKSVHRASKNWLKDFLARHHMNLKMDLPCHTDSAALFRFYDTVRRLHDRLGAVVKPCQVWNCDEMSLRCVSSEGSVVSRVGRQNLHGTDAEGDRDLRVGTVLTCANAAGRVGPTLVVIKENDEDLTWCRRDVMLSCTNNGSLDHDLFAVWFRQLVREAHMNRPLILLLDAENKYISPIVFELATKNGIVLVPIPFLSSGLLQPTEVALMRPLQDLWRRYVDEFQRGDATQVPKYSDFLTWFGTVFTAVTSEDGIIAGFCKTDVYPPYPLVLSGISRSSSQDGSKLSSSSSDKKDFDQRLTEFIAGLGTAD